MLDVPSNNIFLEDKLNGIGDVLNQTTCPKAQDITAVRPGTVLEVTGTAPFHPYQHRHKRERHKSPEGYAKYHKKNIKR